MLIYFQTTVYQYIKKINERLIQNKEHFKLILRIHIFSSLCAFNFQNN